MELWIRSQDKTILSKAQNIIIRENKNENNETNYAIVDIYTMGIYKSKERALEVLDEIHNAILINKVLELTVNKIPVNELNTEKASKLFKDIVYEMPKG